MFDLYYNKAGILRPYIRFIFRRADAVICLSDKWKDFYSTHFKIKKLFILNNVIERPLIAHAAGEGEGPVKLLFLGLIGQRKGLFDLLEVLQRNRDNFRDKYTLTIGGNGEVKRLEETLKNNHQGDPIRFAGWVVGEEKNKLLRDCDIYILPSHNEGLPISILEAMAYRKPIISTTVGGIPEIVKPGYNGWLFAPGDGKGLQQVLEEALNNKSLLKTYGLNSYALTADYTPEAVMRSLAILYDEVLD
jgi:glycosyltransferase involved in cell wall biosynthesis